MHIDKYTVQNFGTRWTKGKDKKGQLLAVLNGEDISFKNLLPLLEQWNESVNGEWADRKIELILNVRERTDDSYEMLKTVAGICKTNGKIIGLNGQTGNLILLLI